MIYNKNDFTREEYETIVIKKLLKIEKRILDRLLRIENILSPNEKQTINSKQKRKNSLSGNKKVIQIRKCIHCGQELEDKSFYKSNGSLYIGNDNLIPICKNCIKALYEEYKITYINQYSALNIELAEKDIEKQTIKRICMIFDIYYSDRIFESATKNREKFPNLDLITAYMKITNLKPNHNKTYDATIIEENLSQELLKSSMVNKTREKFNDDELYKDIYDLCMKTTQLLKEKIKFK